MVTPEPAGTNSEAYCMLPLAKKQIQGLLIINLLTFWVSIIKFFPVDVKTVLIFA